MTNLTKYEMETVVNYNAGEQTATVYIRDKSVMLRLDRLVFMGYALRMFLRA